MSQADAAAAINEGKHTVFFFLVFLQDFRVILQSD